MQEKPFDVPSLRMAGRRMPVSEGNAGVPTVIVFDAEGTVISVSGTFEVNEGYSRYEILGRNAADLRSGSKDRHLYGTVWFLAHGHEPGTEPPKALNVPSDRGKYDVIPVCDPLGRVTNYVAVRGKPEEGLPPESRAEVLPHPDSLRKLAAGLAHNINNQLCVISAYAGLLLRHRNGDGRAELELILDAEQRIASTVRRLLAYAQMQVVHPKRTDLNALLASIRDELAAKAGGGIEIRCDFAQDLGSVRIDGELFGAALADLAENARGRMPGGGTVSLRTANVDLAESFVRQGVTMRNGRYVTVSIHVSDEGPAGRAGARIFEPFSEDLAEDHGLLLPAVYGGVKQSGGFLWVFTRPGSGTSFNIYLPRVE